MSDEKQWQDKYVPTSSTVKEYAAKSLAVYMFFGLIGIVAYFAIDVILKCFNVGG